MHDSTSGAERTAAEAAATGGAGPAAEAADFWENRYSSRGQVWSGDPNPHLVDAARALEPGDALDLGCGEGGDTVWLAGRGWQVAAVDISATALHRTTSCAVDAGVAHRVTTARHDLASTFPAGTYDLVNAQYLQTPYELPRAEVFRRAARALRPGGLLLIVDHGSVHPWGWVGHEAHAEVRFPSAEEVFGELQLDPARWAAECLESPEREATGPEGQRATVTDNVIRVRRLTA
jgi:SAM-dependent methyltransferase